MAAAAGRRWGELLAFGLGRLRLSPDAFWAMSLPEFRAAALGLFGPPAFPPDRAALDALMRQFPDSPPETDHVRDR
ncbi:MAG: phage tail assembly chaperone [Beijerinckiaceae bacterium]|nr:phage tail assembly chaperone [Beijerinckiaceae bacterium]